MSIRSYVRSTDNHCESRSKYVFPSIYVSIDVFGIAARAIPSTNTQRQLIHHKSAMVTTFTAREKAVNLDQFFAVPFAFILKLTKHLPPSSIGDRPSKLAVTNHISNCQVFNSNQVVTIDQISSQLMQKIGTSIFNFGVYPSYFKSCFISVIRAFGFPTQFLLRNSKLLIQLVKMLWITYFQSFASGQQSRDTYINAYLFFGLWQDFNTKIIYQQRNKPSTRRFELNCNSRWITPSRQESRPYYIQWLFTFSKPKSVVFVLKSRLGKFSRTAIAFSFKPWILSSFTPDICKSLLQMSETLLPKGTLLTSLRKSKPSVFFQPVNKLEVLG